MPYTAHDTPALVARIDGDLADVVATVRAGDPRLRSLVLTGGFARGEGTVLDGAPQNDYDFVALRGVGPVRTRYADLRAVLERRLGLHVDLAPVAVWRLPWVPASVFWYETALRGRVLWGEDLRSRIPIRTASRLDPAEGLRLLANRAAGLLLATAGADAPAVRIQAVKALLAALDARLLAQGAFPPSQTERWRMQRRLLSSGTAPPELRALAPWFEWAYRSKVGPPSAPARDPQEAWCAARRAILEALPTALRHAGLPSLRSYGRSDRMADRIVYGLRMHRVPGAHRLVAHPTGQVRVATLRLLAASGDGRVRLHDAQRCFSGIAPAGKDPLRTLAGLRAATLQ